MITLITGTPGSGKTLYAVSLLDKYLTENKKLLERGEAPRNLYADIDGLQMEGVEIPPDDWRDTPDGSVIFYDEIQQRAAYKKGKNDNPIVDALQVHRHTGHDIYGITQFPVLLHSNFKAVVGIHAHLHRGWGLMAATVYQWAYCIDSPNAKSNKRIAEHDFRFSFPKRLFGYYKSATQHTHKARIPKKFLFVIAAIVVLLFFLYRQLTQENTITNILGGKQQVPAVVPPVVDQNAGLPPSHVEPVPSAVPVSLPQSHSQGYNQSVQGIYDPLSNGYITDVNLVPISAVSFNGRCSVYNANGNILTHVSPSDCERYLSVKGMLPTVKTNRQEMGVVPTTTTRRRNDNEEAEAVQRAPTAALGSDSEG